MFKIFSPPMFLKSVLNVLLIFAPSAAFLPQIMAQNITYSPLLSLLSIISAILKISHYHVRPSSVIYLYQFIFVIVIHFYLLKHYKQPLKSMEARLFQPKLYMRYGLIVSASAIIVTAFTFINILSLFNLSFTFSFLAAFLDVMITLLQIHIYKSDKEKPRETFAVWVLGDLIKIWLMFGETEFVYIAVSGFQVCINSYMLWTS